MTLPLDLISEPHEMGSEDNQVIVGCRKAASNNMKLKQTMLLGVGTLMTILINVTYLPASFIVGFIVDPTMMPKPNTDNLFHKFNKEDSYKEYSALRPNFVSRTFESS